jgi:hypothetical protein
VIVESEKVEYVRVFQQEVRRHLLCVAQVCDFAPDHFIGWRDSALRSNSIDCIRLPATASTTSAPIAGALASQHVIPNAVRAVSIMRRMPGNSDAGTNLVILSGVACERQESDL